MVHCTMYMYSYDCNGFYNVIQFYLQLFMECTLYSTRILHVQCTSYYTLSENLSDDAIA